MINVGYLFKKAEILFQLRSYYYDGFYNSCLAAVYGRRKILTTNSLFIGGWFVTLKVIGIIVSAMLEVEVSKWMKLSSYL